MVAHLVRLKLALLRNTFRRSRAQSIGAVVGILYFGILVIGLAILAASLRTSIEDATVVLPLAGAVGVILWTVVPLFSFGTDPTLDPARFATFAIPPRTLAIGLIASALVGLPSVATMVLVSGTVVAWSHTALSTVVGLAGAIVGLLTAITLSRYVSALATRAISTRRGNDLMVGLGIALFVIVGPFLSVVGHGDRDWTEIARTASTIVGWTPLGWAWAAPADVAAGATLTGIVRLLLAVAFLLLLLRAWSAAVMRQVQSPHAVSRSDRGTSADGDLGLFARAPDDARGAVAARVLTYWRRDPRYQVAMFMTPILPLGLLIPFFTTDTRWAPLLMGPLVSFMLGWSEHNSVAYESTAFWMHVAAGTPGRADRLGRLVPNLALAAVLAPIYCIAGVWIGDRWDLLPAAFGVSVALLGAGYALSSVMSIAMPYPVPKPGESPFTTPPGAAGATLLSQMAASIGTLLLAGPAVAAGWSAYHGVGGAAWLALAIGAALGPGLAWAGVRAGAALHDRRAPELLLALGRD